MMQLSMGKREMEMGGKYLGTLREANDLLEDMPSLRARMAEDGYLLLRGLHDPQTVLATRRSIMANLAENGQVDTSFPVEDGVIAPGGKGRFLGGSKAMTRTPEFLALVESEPLMRFFTEFLGAPAVTYDYKWLRAISTGDFTGAHYDIVYMGRGTTNVYTCWTPLGDVSYESGPLAILSDSHRLEAVKETYGKMDVDRDRVAGWFTSNPHEMVDRYGGQWLTTEFKAGDALIFGMYTLHGSINNTTNRYRISCDTRYQRADEPVDPRWVGEDPEGHTTWMQGETVPMEEARKRWGV